MHTILKSKNKSGAILFGFPGMGKTTYALRNAGVIDLDFGMFREAHKVSKKEEHSLFATFSRLVLMYYRDGYIVLTNEPALIPLVKQGAEGKVFMILPDVGEKAYVDRIIQRSLNSDNHSSDFADQMRLNIRSWLDDWMNLADRYDIPIEWCTYLTKGVINHVVK